MSYHLSRAALADLDEISEFISRDNPAAASRLLNEIEAICARLVEYPRLGRARPELSADVRSMSHGNYVVFYREFSERIEIVRVLHAARDITSEFFE